MIRRLVPAFLALALAGCGFHLRHALVLPPDVGPIKVVSASRYSPLAESLAQSLERSGATIAPGNATDVAVLEVIAERWGDTPISVDARGRAQEYSLRYATIFELRGEDGHPVVPRQAIELSRDYISEPTNSVGTEGERDVLVKELRREMTASILRRVDAVARRQFEDGTYSRLQAPAAEDPDAIDFDDTAPDPFEAVTEPEPERLPVEIIDDQR